MSEGPPEVTELLRRARDGDADAERELIATTYAELRRLAHARLRGLGQRDVLDTTSLVNEWYLRFARAESVRIEDRHHFMRYAARVMRSVIVDFVRRRTADRRGGGAPHVSLSMAGASIANDGREEIMRVHESLESLAALDERMAEIVEMRYFAGMREPEIAEALGVSERTVRRDWAKARLWLAEALAG